jgi:hypothetical protein
MRAARALDYFQFSFRFQQGRFAGQSIQRRFYPDAIVLFTFCFGFKSGDFIFNFLFGIFEIGKLGSHKFLRFFCLSEFRAPACKSTIKRRNNFSQRINIRAQNFQFRFVISQNFLHDKRNEIFRNFQKSRQIYKRNLRLNIQNSVRCLRVLLFSALKVGPKQ